MGITVSSKNHSFNIGYGGFSNLRNKVAELTNGEIFNHYKDLDKIIFYTGEKSKQLFCKYNAKTNELWNQHDEFKGVINFLYAPDCGAEIDSGDCIQLYNVIKNYDNDILYGYSGMDDCAKFKDFKEIVKDCIKNKCNLGWN